MKIAGRCHRCNISYEFEAGAEWSARACGCTFCVKHGGVWTSDAGGRLLARIRDRAALPVAGR